MKYLNDISKDCIEKVFKSKSSGDFKILKYNNSKNVEIQFLKTGFEAITRLGNIKSGGVKDRLSPSVCGVGILGTKYPSMVSGVLIKEYALLIKRYRSCSKVCMKYFWYGCTSTHIKRPYEPYISICKPYISILQFL